MAFLKADTPLDVFKHLLLIAVAGGLLVLGFFYVYLPMSTHHGETITVPKVTGMNVADLENYLEERNLNYFVDDSSYSPNIRPFTVLVQDPAPGEKVKEGRKIYLQVSMKNPPVIKMPKLTDGSSKNAMLILKSYDLVVGQIQPGARFGAECRAQAVGQRQGDCARRPHCQRHQGRPRGGRRPGQPDLPRAQPREHARGRSHHPAHRPGPAKRRSV
ncbi:PASTA domain-containing protein [Hymenobacter humi]|uniref:PASTA domain-containing protein n=1 Tax=Hymenobacter humi TaxID=1411620 RepID=A0ABW2UC16_9BACT